METFRVVMLVVSCVLILFGYFRLITDENGNVDLNGFRFTGGLGRVVAGMIEGTWDMFSGKISANGISALAIYVGSLIFYVCFNQSYQ